MSYYDNFYPEFEDIIETKKELDTVFSFELEDLTPVEYIAETLSFTELNSFILFNILNFTLAVQY